jgi:monoamine oxidase
VLWQDAHGRVKECPMDSPMAMAQRIQGGVGALTQRIETEISAENILLGHVLKGLQIHEDGLRAEVQGPEGVLGILSRQVALAIPPHLARTITNSSALPEKAQQLLESTRLDMQNSSRSMMNRSGGNKDYVVLR